MNPPLARPLFEGGLHGPVVVHSMVRLRRQERRGRAGQVQQEVDFGAWQATVSYGFPQPDGRRPPGTKDAHGAALIVRLGPDEFLVTGIDASVSFHRPGRLPRLRMQILSAEEGTYDKGTWRASRLWNSRYTRTWRAGGVGPAVRPGGGAMITTGEARRIAEAWLREEAPRVPELVGAILVGSTRARDSEAPHPAASDVDVFLWVDAEVPSDIEHPRGRFAPRKLLRSGVVLEPSFHDARRIADPEAVLGDVHLGPAFADPLILLDPTGRLAAVADAVRPEYRRRRHVQRRLAQVLTLFEAMSAHPRAPELPTLAPCWRNVALAVAVMFAAIAPLVAALRFPTVRRSLVVAREVLAEGGREDLADALLRLAGGATLSRAEVEERVAELWMAYDTAVEARRTPVVMDWNVSREARALECAAIGELVAEGHHREAAYPLLQLRTAVQGILENDGDEEVRGWSRAGYGRLLAALGIESEEAFDARGEALQAFVPDLRKGCEELLARNPAVLD